LFSILIIETSGLRDARPRREPYKVVISEVPELNKDGAIDLADVEYLLTPAARLKHSGNVRSIGGCDRRREVLTFASSDSASPTGDAKERWACVDRKIVECSLTLVGEMTAR
jgi:hypothetical protein